MKRILLVILLVLTFCPASYAKTIRVGDEVVFLYWGCDSQKEVEEHGTVLGIEGDKYTILPLFKIHPFNTYVTVTKDKIIK